jgi:GTPase SAR1 family protein
MPSSPVHAQDRVLLPPWVRICRWLWKVSGFLGTAILLSLGVNLLSTSLTSSRGLFPANSPFAALVMHWPITLPISCCFLLVAALAGAISRWYPASRALPLPTEQDHERMVRRLRLRYRQLLAQTLQGAALLDLGLSRKPDAVSSAAALALRLPDQPEQLLPFGTSLVSVYDEAEQELLILGEPGAGKSTLLMELAQHLVERAEQERSLPLPVILPLSSWAVRQLPLPDWMGEQMTLLYDVPRHLSQQWMREGHLLPLLDGLDEMEASARAACIVSINAYHQEHLRPLVVCSRTAEYDTASTHERLALHRAVVVQPLTKQQVDISLRKAGKPMDGLRAALKKNPVLQELAITPLWLSVLMLTYQGKTARDLPKLGSLLQQQQIFTHYIERMVERKGNLVRYPLQSTQIWLGWLARQMRMHNQTNFYLEYLQTDWLPERRRPFYQWSVGLVAGLVVGLVGALLGGLLGALVGVGLVGLLRSSVLRSSVLLSALVGVLVGALLGVLVVWLVGGLVGGLVGVLLFWLVVVLVGVLVVWLLVVLGFWLGVVVQHFILRLWLWGTGLFPWNAHQFLDDAVARILLRRVGRGYTFTHSLLQDFFTDLDSGLPITATHLANQPLASPPSEHEHEHKEQEEK